MFRNTPETRQSCLIALLVDTRVVRAVNYDVWHSSSKDVPAPKNELVNWNKSPSAPSATHFTELFKNVCFWHALTSHFQWISRALWKALLQGLWKTPNCHSRKSLAPRGLPWAPLHKTLLYYCHRFSSGSLAHPWPLMQWAVISLMSSSLSLSLLTLFSRYYLKDKGMSRLDRWWVPANYGVKPPASCTSWT